MFDSRFDVAAPKRGDLLEFHIDQAYQCYRHGRQLHCSMTKETVSRRGNQKYRIEHCRWVECPLGNDAELHGNVYVVTVKDDVIIHLWSFTLEDEYNWSW